MQLTLRWVGVRGAERTARCAGASRPRDNGGRAFTEGTVWDRLPLPGVLSTRQRVTSSPTPAAVTSLAVRGSLSVSPGNFMDVLMVTCCRKSADHDASTH